MANEITIKGKYSAKCPHCGLSATGTLTMNDRAYAWLDAAWKAHLDACRAKAESKKE